MSNQSRIASLRGQGRWDAAVELAGDDPLLRADLRNEEALFTGSATARAAAARELDRVEARLQAERGRILHARFLSRRDKEDPGELAHFEASLAAARRARDPLLVGWARFWIGIVHQVIRDDHRTALPHFQAAYRAGKAGSGLLASYAVRHLAYAWDDAGRHDDAWRGFTESLELRRAERFWPGVAAATLTLAEISHERGRPEEARRLVTEARRIAKRCGAVAFLARADELARSFREPDPGRT
jgi:tetratricopeptide (TPR) repeat protein